MARLLLLDGSASLLQSVQTRLQDVGHEVMAFASGRQALAQIEDAHFDVFILDLNVGDVSAFDITTKISTNTLNWNSPIIVMTEHPQPEALFKVMNAGASFVLAKPFAFSTLLDKVEQLLNPRDVRKGAFDPLLVRGFLDAVVHVVGRLGDVHVAAGKPFLKEGTLALCDVNALVDLRGGGVCGSLCLSMHPDTLETLLSRLFGFDASDRLTDSLLRDAALEIVNLIAGEARRVFRRDQGIVITPGASRNVQGAGLEIPYAARAPVLVVPFSVPTSWPFYLEFCLLLGENEPLIPGSSSARAVLDPGDVNFL